MIGNPPLHPDPAGAETLVPLTVQVRPATLRKLRAAGAREGASPEAVGALWLEEYAQAIPDPTVAGVPGTPNADQSGHGRA